MGPAGPEFTESSSEESVTEEVVGTAAKSKARPPSPTTGTSESETVRDALLLKLSQQMGLEREKGRGKIARCVSIAGKLAVVFRAVATSISTTTCIA